MCHTKEAASRQLLIARGPKTSTFGMVGVGRVYGVAAGCGTSTDHTTIDLHSTLKLLGVLLLLVCVVVR